MSAWTGYSQNKIKKQNYQFTEISAPSRNTLKTYRAQDIVAANLFGDPAPVKQIKEAPKTTLNLTLQGILSATDSSLARAIIQKGKSSSELYSVGEKIKGAGAAIKEIRINDVLLDRNGAIESLPLIKKGGKNNQIISYSESPYANKINADVAAVDSLSIVNRSGRDATTSANRPRAANGAPRKIRKPNFSGLDRALQKMGEL